MIRTITALVAGVCLLCGCAVQTNPMEKQETQTSVQEQENTVAGNAANLLSDEQAYATLLNLYEKALPAMFWYYNDPGEDLELAQGDPLDMTDAYRKVGRFGSIEEMKAETEQYFTQDFCENRLYPQRFEGTETPMYMQRDDGLYRNVNIGGMGWPFALSGDYTVSYQDEGLLVLKVKLKLFDEEEEWHPFVLKKENDHWKIHQWFTFAPYADEMRDIEPAVSAWFCASNWSKVGDLHPSQLLTFYMNQYLRNLDGDYSDIKPYSASGEEVVQKLKVHFPDITLENLLDKEPNPSVEYDKAKDTFLFYLTFDPATYVVTDKQQIQEHTLLTVLVLGKGDRASYWGKLAVQKTEAGFRYLSNAFTDIPA